jgi:cell division protein FtsA
MARRERAAVLDLGATWVTCMLAETTDKGQMRIAGYGRTPADGFRGGSVVHPEKAIQSIFTAWQEACKMAGFKLDLVYCSVTGERLRYIRGKGSVAVRRPRKGISQADLDEVIEQARAIALPQAEMILHLVPIHYIVDGQKNVDEPRGLFGTRLEVEVHIVIAPVAVVENIHRVVDGAGLRPKKMLLRGMAAVLGGADMEERKMGVALVHLGAQTEVVAYKECSLRHNSVLELGGEHVTNDISFVLHVPQPLAEKLKVENGSAIAARVEAAETISFPVQNTTRQLTPGLLASIIEPRVEEILWHVESELRKIGQAEFLSGGAVLSGGAARLPGIDAVAERVLNLPVRVGTAVGLQGPDAVLTDPSFVPCAGLVRYALSAGKDIGNNMIEVGRKGIDWKSLFRTIVRRFGWRG